MNENLYSIQIEQSVLAALLVFDKGIDDYMDLLSEDSFYPLRHKIIFRVLKMLFEDGKTHDAIAVYDCIRSDATLCTQVSEKYMMDLLTSHGSAHLVDGYIEILSEHKRRRSIFDAAERIRSIASDTTQYTSESALATCESVLGDIDFGSSNSSMQDAFKLSVELFDSINQRIKDRANNSEIVNGIRTGFEALDKQIGVLAKGDLIYVGARPSMGKTALAQDMMLSVAIYQQHPVIFHSIEMTAEKIGQRLISSVAEINSRDIRDATIPDDKWRDFNDASLLLNKSKFLIDDSSSITVSDIRRNCRKVKNKYGYVGAVFIDYLTLITSSMRSDRNDLMVGSISKALKRLAKEFDCPVVCLAQLSRSLEKRPDKRPMLSDLRESGSIEEDADVVLFIYRDEYYNKASQDAGTAEIIAAKVRDGEVGTVRLATELQYSRFVDLDEEYYRRSLSGI